MATWPPRAAKHMPVVLQAGLHTGSEGGAGFTSRGSRSTGGRASRTALSQTSCVKGGTHSNHHLVWRTYGVAIRQTTVCSCIPPVTDKSIAKRWTEHHRVPQGAFERLELLEGKLSRAVLRGLGGSNPARLPGDKETGRKALRLVLTQRRERHAGLCLLDKKGAQEVVRRLTSQEQWR
jgi:hypothetical protein